MFRRRTEEDSPGKTSGPTTMRQGYHQKIMPIEQRFFGTSVYSFEELNDVSNLRVLLLFRRMRAELEYFAHDFANNHPSHDKNVRTGIIIEMIVASEFLVHELDCDIARLRYAGSEAEKNGSEEQWEHARKSVAILSKVRIRVSELQRELDSMIEVTLRIFQHYSVSASLDFDPFIHEKQGSSPFLMLFLHAVGETVAFISQLAHVALQERDFESLAELSRCNLQLSSFLEDTKRISFVKPERSQLS